MLILQHTVLLASNWLALLTQQRTRLSALYLMNLFSMDFSQYERVYECNVSIEAIPIPLIESINQRSRIRNISTALKIILQHLSAQHTFLLFNEPNDDDQRISSKVTFAAKEEGDPGFNPNATHVQIGSLYARITREQYVEMLSRSPRVVEELNNIPTPGPKAAKALKKWKWSKVFLARARNPKGIKKPPNGFKEPKSIGESPIVPIGAAVEGESEYTQWSCDKLQEPPPQWKVALFQSMSKTFSNLEKQFNFAAEMTMGQLKAEKPNNVSDPVDVLAPIDSLVNELKIARPPKLVIIGDYWKNREEKIVAIGRLIEELEGNAPLAKIKDLELVVTEALFKAF